MHIVLCTLTLFWSKLLSGKLSFGFSSYEIVLVV